jgi:hypothetical protein
MRRQRVGIDASGSADSSAQESLLGADEFAVVTVLPPAGTADLVVWPTRRQYIGRVVGYGGIVAVVVISVQTLLLLQATDDGAGSDGSGATTVPSHVANWAKQVALVALVMLCASSMVRGPMHSHVYALFGMAKPTPR